MNYGDERPELLKYDPFKAIIAPRPIGWIGTLNADGVPNLAPYSFFNGIGSRPNQLFFSSEGEKHSYLNAKARGEFTVSLATEALKDEMNISSAHVEDGVSEFELAGLELGKPVEIATPFVAASPAAFECVVIATMQMKDRFGNLTDRYLTFGEVVRTHIADDYISNGRFDSARARPIARLGYRDYATVENVWQLKRPQEK